MGFAVASEAIARVIADRNFILSDFNDVVEETSLFLTERYYANVRDSEGGDESGFLSIFSNLMGPPLGLYRSRLSCDIFTLLSILQMAGVAKRFYDYEHKV